MATQTIFTRVKNKVDTLAKWQASTTPLLAGEIALVRVPTGATYVNPVTGQSEPVVELLMKVGDGSTAFNALPWLSAKASDVYNWAKKPTAAEVPVKIITGTGDNAVETSMTLGELMQSLKENLADVSALKTAVDVEKVSTAISGAIAALDSTRSGTGNFVKSVVQTDGKVAVTYGTISESELPNISASKIIVDDKNTTLATKLAAQDALIAENAEKLSADQTTAVGTMIDTKLGALDVADQGTGYVTAVTQTDGKIAVTKANLPTANASTAGIAKLGATGGAATYDAIFGADGKGGINAQVNTNTTDIASLKTSVSGGVHFVGITTTAIEDGSTAKSLTISGKDTAHTPTAGDVVLYGEKEFIWSGTAWKELGDLSRVGAVETALTGLSSTKADNKFVTHISKDANGKYVVNTAQPTSANIEHSGETLASYLADHVGGLETKVDIADGKTVTAAISDAINALDASAPAASGTATAFISSVSQTDGKITATKANLPTASDTVAGIVKLGAEGGAAPYSVVTDVSAIESNYLRFNSTDEKLYLGKDDTYEIIFDCGGAPV